MKRLLAGALATTMILSMFVGCGSKEEKKESTESTKTETTEKTESSKDSIAVGLYGTITGSNALAGEMLEKGAKLAVDQINAEGGINGQLIDLKVYDDKSTPEGALKAVTRMVDVDKVSAIVASNSSPNILATAQITEEAKVIQVGSGTSTAYTAPEFDYMFRGTASSVLPNEAFINSMKDDGVKTIAILSVASEYGLTGVNSVKELLGDIEIIVEETYQQTDTDYTGQVSKIVNADPDAVVIYGMTNELALSIKQLRRSGYEKAIYGPEGLGSPDIVNVAGDAANGVIFGSGAVIPASVEDASSDVEKQFLEDFVEVYGGMPVSDVAYRGYDSVKLIAIALENASDVADTQTIRDAFVQIKGFEGIGGTYDFTDESGEGLFTARSYIIEDGKNILYK